MNKTLTQAIAILALFTAISLQAQVTIGSDQAPNKGALLDLTEGATTKKGLGLPRVILSDITKLKMRSEEILDTDYDGDQYEKHRGLIVYAIQRFGTNPVKCPGIYIWDGARWESLSPLPRSNKANITMTDSDGNVYNAKWFHHPCDPEEGAYWITTNMYTTKNASGGSIGTAYMNPALYTPVSGNAIAINSPTDLQSGTILDYGISTISGDKNIKGQSYLDFAKTYGLLYTWSQALEACPTGWHLPLNQDWNNLRTWLGTNLGVVMRKSTEWKRYYISADATSTSTIWGSNDGDVQPIASGFDAVPSGYVDRNGSIGRHFGYEAIFWLGEINSYAPYVRMIRSDVTGFTSTNYNGGINVNLKHSVRCVKD